MQTFTWELSSDRKSEYRVWIRAKTVNSARDQIVEKLVNWRNSMEKKEEWDLDLFDIVYFGSFSGPSDGDDFKELFEELEQEEPTISEKDILSGFCASLNG